MLQPKLFGVTPFPITFAWLMVAIGSWQLARLTRQAIPALARIPAADLALSATLVMTIDLQIETVATFINNYWIWLDGGPFYSVPTINFVAWWVVGFVISGVVTLIIGRQPAAIRALPLWGRMPWSIRAERLMRLIPTLLYVLSSVMFTLVNFGRGYPLAGMVGVIFLGIALLVATRGWKYLSAEGGRARQIAD
jgi:putative membrane protein